MAEHFYLQKHPKLWKWMNVCIGCNATGYKPELPEQLAGGPLSYHLWWRNSYAQQLRFYFHPLPVDEHGLCEQCQRFNNPWKDDPQTAE